MASAPQDGSCCRSLGMLSFAPACLGSFPLGGGDCGGTASGAGAKVRSPELNRIGALGSGVNSDSL